MKVPDILSKCKAKTLVFRYGGTGEARTRTEDGPASDEWVTADSQSVNSLFERDRGLAERFRHFLKAGCLGVFLVRDRQWISYGWSSQPGHGHPPHLSQRVSAAGAYWIFFCHTREGFRGQGVYRRLLHRIVVLVIGREPAATIYVDAYAGNTPSRQAILSVGFSPGGVMTTYKLWLPRVGSFVLASYWRRNETHPAL